MTLLTGEKESLLVFILKMILFAVGLMTLWALPQTVLIWIAIIVLAMRD